MLRFLANIIEQIDLALEHVVKGDANNARFGLMLIDNAVEITLHQIAKDMQTKAESYRYREKPYEHAAILQDALGRNLEPKVKFAREIGRLDGKVSESVNIFHVFRNEVFHIGVQHEAILPTITEFYFELACDFVGAYSPPWIFRNGRGSIFRTRSISCGRPATIMAHAEN